ncbi:sulfur oxidation c-type cytochrome SoxA [Thiohalobacter sp. IOR34]|uniref:sulfur oxidation c-type cytochrome SoxA n=1 Tax=Thiohalobacter sp. IOR34 TaxID=3057176 RepID=UPI0025B23586|nr:sulfur oxidation c-type cytochrome SoxA [Thiohalobacter sp. IOR34]WJW75922.1 sulfur oxidation c-type cytochrome SoxA [Thiohalobacter sp. IOR34]
MNLGSRMSLLLVALLSVPTVQAGRYVPWQAEGLSIPRPLGGLQGDPARGRAVVIDSHQGNCLACHRLPIADQPFQGNLGPPLAGIGARLSPGELRLRVADERRLNPETVMPPFHVDPRSLNQVAFAVEGQTFLSAQQVEDVVAYLSTLTEPGEAGTPPVAASPGNGLHSGYDYLKPETRAMQDDEFANPGMPTVDRGRRLFNAEGENGKSCASCHGEDGEGLDPARIASYPVYDPDSGRPRTLQEQINICWEDQLDNIPYVYDCTELVALEAFVRHRARGTPVQVDIDGPLRPFYEAGRKLYHTRFGQANLACTHCHDLHAGQWLRGQQLTQGQSNGFPEYRLGSGRITSLQRRFSECFRSFRAEPFEPGSQAYIDLEVYVNARGNGLKIETPAVRY